MNKNSLKVYYESILPDIKKRHLKVMNALSVLGEATSLEVADYLNVPLHSISGRISELSSSEYGKPLIEAIGTKKNRYGNTCAIYRIKQYHPEGKQAEIF